MSKRSFQATQLYSLWWSSFDFRLSIVCSTKLKDPKERFEEASEDLKILKATFSNMNAFGDQWSASQSEDITHRGQNVRAQEDVG